MFSPAYVHRVLIMNFAFPKPKYKHQPKGRIVYIVNEINQQVMPIVFTTLVSD